jgi:hypothetical protein
MTNAITQFNSNTKSIDDLIGLYKLINENFPLLNDQSDEILRASIVLIVSAFDTFIHDLIRLGMIECFLGARIKTKKFEKFDVGYINFERILKSASLSDQANFFELDIREKHSKLSFQSSSSIEQAVGLIGLNSIWSSLSAADKLNTVAKDIKDTLDLIIRRRNSIAHEADFNYSIGSKNPISLTIVNHAFTFIKSLSINIMKLI